MKSAEDSAATRIANYIHPLSSVLKRVIGVARAKANCPCHKSISGTHTEAETTMS